VKVRGESSGDAQALRVAQRGHHRLDRPGHRRLDRYRVESALVKMAHEVCQRDVVAPEAIAEGAAQGQVVLGRVLQGWIQIRHRCTPGHGWTNAATAWAAATA